MKTSPSPQTLGHSIRTRRENIAGMSISRFTTMVCMELPPARWITDETIRRYEKDLVPAEKADPILVAAMASVLKCSVDELSVEVAEGTLTIKQLLAAVPVTRDESEDESHSRCNPTFADEPVPVGATP